MAGKPLHILLASGEHEKIQLAAMVASVAAVSDRPVTVLVSMSAIKAFARGKAPAERYQPGGDFAEVLGAANVPDPLDLFAQGRKLGDMKMWACALVMDLLHWTEDDLVENLFDGRLGLTRFLADAEAGDLMTL